MKQLLIAFLFGIAVILNCPHVSSQNILPLPKNGKTYVIAHRGIHNGIPENTLPAYQRAIDAGCDFVEIDVRTTIDGAIVSVHNSTIDAYVTGKTGKVREMTLAELKSLEVGVGIDKRWANTKIPIFDEILELCHGKIGIYLDLKDADPAVLISRLRAFGMEQNTVWYIPASFHKTIMEIKQSCPECLVMPDPGVGQNIEKIVVAYEPKLIATDMDHLNASFTNKAHKYGIMVFADDNENDPAKWESEWDKMVGWGTDGIQTDQPEALIKYLKKIDN